MRRLPKLKSKPIPHSAVVVGVIAAVVVAVTMCRPSTQQKSDASEAVKTPTTPADSPKSSPAPAPLPDKDTSDARKTEPPATADDYRVDDSLPKPGEIKAPRGGYTLIAIPGGQFPMGINSEFKSHVVHIQPFYLGKYEVTNEEYARFVKAVKDVPKPPYWENELYDKPKQPVVGVTWDEAKKYCDWAGLRLPSEAEWEWAARAGSVSNFQVGDFEKDLETVAWFAGDLNGPSPVGKKAVNKFGLYDMLGNVWEWVEDDNHKDYNGAPTDGSAWIDTPRSEDRIVRGGSFNYSSDNCRTAARGVWWLGVRDFSLGFRAAKSVP